MPTDPMTLVSFKVAAEVWAGGAIQRTLAAFNLEDLTSKDHDGDGPCTGSQLGFMGSLQRQCGIQGAALERFDAWLTKQYGVGGEYETLTCDEMSEVLNILIEKRRRVWTADREALGLPLTSQLHPQERT